MIRGRSAATAAAEPETIAALWNGHATQRVRVLGFSVIPTSAPPANKFFRVMRISARGTPGSTVTPAIQNHSRRGVAPVSGVVLDLAQYSVQPTASGMNLWDYADSTVAAGGEMFPLIAPVTLAPSTGLALRVFGVATAYPISEVFFVWEEDL